jgi:hypothetical protein
MTLAEKMRKFADIIDGTADFNRILTKDEYRFVKEFPMQECVEEFWKNHLTEKGYLEYRRAASQGCHGKWKIYQKIYEYYKTPLVRFLK